MLKIGITEAGDAGLDLSWVSAVESNRVQGAILITKNLTEKFSKEVLRLHQQNYKLIVHATCTGWGGSVMEPYVPAYNIQIDNLCKLIASGFPVEQCVLRLDPIIPTEAGLLAVTNVLQYVATKNLLSNIRIRFSVMDEYRHVKARLQKAGFAPCYGDSMQPSETQIQNMIQLLSSFGKVYETCAEAKLWNPKNTIIFEKVGCVSEKDLKFLGINISEELKENPQNRFGCKCLSCKQELLSHKHRCPHGCLYCYWRD